jgi:hypothetical protein
LQGCKADLAIEFEMKDIGLMHYFLGLEVWQVSREIFLGQGKYAVEILRRFRMEDCRPMATPMVTNLKKVVTSDSELVDPRIYRKVDRVLDVFGQHQARYMFCCEHLESVHGGVEAGALDSSEACAQVLERYNGVWIEVSWR